MRRKKRKMPKIGDKYEWTGRERLSSCNLFIITGIEEDAYICEHEDDGGKKFCVYLSFHLLEKYLREKSLKRLELRTNRKILGLNVEK